MGWTVSPRYVGAAVSDADAQTYLRAVEAADGQALELGVQQAVNQFVLGCKADGIWTAIKASCILAGARTLTGALVPLVGTAPKNNGFTNAQYNRKLGIINSVAASLNSNYNHSSLPQNNISMSVFLGSSPTVSGSTFIGSGGGSTGASNIFGSSGANILGSRLQSSSFSSRSFPPNLKNFLGSSRNLSNSYIFRYNQTNDSISINSQTPFNDNVAVFDSAANNYYISFYHIGNSLDLALLDTRITALMSALTAAIP